METPRTRGRGRKSRVQVALAVLLVVAAAGAVWHFAGRERDGVSSDVQKRADETVSTMRALEPPPPDARDAPTTPNGVPGRGPQRK